MRDNRGDGLQLVAGRPPHVPLRLRGSAAAARSRPCAIRRYSAGDPGLTWADRLCALLTCPMILLICIRGKPLDLGVGETKATVCWLHPERLNRDNATLAAIDH